MRYSAIAWSMMRQMRIMSDSGPKRCFAFATSHAAAILGHPIEERTRPISRPKLQMPQFVQNKSAGRDTRIVIAVTKMLLRTLQFPRDRFPFLRPIHERHRHLQQDDIACFGAAEHFEPLGARDLDAPLVLY